MVFGKVIGGMDVVRKVESVARTWSHNISEQRDYHVSCTRTWSRVR